MYLEWCLVLDPTFPNLSVVSGFHNMLFSCFLMTSWLLPLCFFHLHSVVSHILLIICVLGCGFSTHSCNCCRVSCPKVTRGLGANGRNVWCNMGATQPIWIFLPPPSLESTQLCGFAIFSTRFIILHAINLLPSTLLSLFLPPLSVLPKVVWIGGLPAPNEQHSTYLLHPYSPPYPPPVPMIVSPNLSTEPNQSIVLQYISGMQLPPPQLAQNPPILPLERC